MRVLSLCERLCPDKIPVGIGEYISDGSDGEVFSMVNQPDRVIKLCVMYEFSNDDMDDRYNVIKDVLEYTISMQPRAYVCVYEYGYIGTYSRHNYLGDEKFIMYHYVMERLHDISEDERKVFHSILSHEDRGIEKQYSSEQIDVMLKDLAVGLDFDAKRVMLFCGNIESSAIRHQDLHPRNVMRNANGDYKLVDLDRCSIINKKE